MEKGNLRAASIVPVLLWAAFIFWMSSHTAGQMNGGFFAMARQAVNAFAASALGIRGDPVSVLGHFCEYLVLGALLANMLRGSLTGMHAALIALAIASLYGATDEFHQLFVPGRECDPFDWMVDTVAAAVGASVYTALHRRLYSR